MAEEGGDAEDKTLDPSPRRLEKAREEGDVPLAREVVQTAGLAGAAMALSSLGPSLGHVMIEEAQGLFARAHELPLDEAVGTLLRISVPLALGVAGAAALASTAATLLQTRFLVSAKGLMPQFSRINPLAALKRIFGWQGLIELGKQVGKLAALGLVMWWVAGDLNEIAGRQFTAGPAELAAGMTEMLARLISATLAVFAGVAGIDLLVTQIRYWRRHRMTREEMKQEMKDSDGDPHIKAKRMGIMRSRARRRAMQQVPKATVVVTNPTHYSVALAYDAEVDAAPRVVAKGVDALALQIRKVAAEHDVPILENPPLARALYRLDEDAPIPAEHFQAVAELIALVWRLYGKRT
jgi:flagellar biosynthetic protein FlhB